MQMITSWAKIAQSDCGENYLATKAMYDISRMRIDTENEIEAPITQNGFLYQYP